MVPVNVFPVCVICHVIWPIMPGDMPAPIIDPLESDTLPLHVPDSDPDWLVGLGPTGFLAVGDCAPQADRARRLEKRDAAIRERMRKLLLPAITLWMTGQRVRPDSSWPDPLSPDPEPRTHTEECALCLDSATVSEPDAAVTPISVGPSALSISSVPDQRGP